MLRTAVIRARQVPNPARPVARAASGVRTAAATTEASRAAIYLKDVAAAGDGLRFARAAVHFAQQAANSAQQAAKSAQQAANSACTPQFVPHFPPFFGPGSPAHPPLVETIATLFDAAKQRTMTAEDVWGKTRADSRGVCIVGNRGTGTTTILEAAAAAAAHIPGIERVVQIDVGTDGTISVDNRLCDLLERRFSAPPEFLTVPSPVTAVFLNNAHSLCGNSWNTVRHLLRPAEKRIRRKRGGVDVVGSFPTFIVVAAGDQSTMARVSEPESGDVQNYMRRVHVEPMWTKSQYRALRRHVLESNGMEAAKSAQGAEGAEGAEGDDVDAAIGTWHTCTGGNWDKVHRRVGAQKIVLGEPLDCSALLPDIGFTFRAVSKPGASEITTRTVAAACLQLLRHKIQELRRDTAEPRSLPLEPRSLRLEPRDAAHPPLPFCPFLAGSVTVSHFDLENAIKSWMRRDVVAARDSLLNLSAASMHHYMDRLISDVCDAGFLRVKSVEPGFESDAVPAATSRASRQYALGAPFFGMTRDEWTCMRKSHCLQK